MFCDMIDQIIEFNKTFVAQKGYEKYLTDKYPDKKLAVLSCMDTRLTELLPAALGLKNGDAKIIKNAGGLVISAFDSAMRSFETRHRRHADHADAGYQHGLPAPEDTCRRPSRSPARRASGIHELYQVTSQKL